jgi:hypothetical protein
MGLYGLIEIANKFHQPKAALPARPSCFQERKTTMDMYKTPCMHDPLSPAIQRCCDARTRIFLHHAAALRAPENLATDNPAMDSEKLCELLTRAAESRDVQKAGAAAFRYAMPDPSTREGIKDFIACVLHGMTVDAIDTSEGYALLAGARVALAALKYIPTPAESKEKENIDFSGENGPQAA